MGQKDHSPVVADPEEKATKGKPEKAIWHNHVDSIQGPTPQESCPERQCCFQKEGIRQLTQIRDLDILAYT